MELLKPLIVTLFVINSLIPFSAIAAKCTANGVPYDTCICFPSGDCVDVGDPGVYP